MYYKNPNTNEVYYYESLEFVKPGLVSITESEALSLAAATAPVPTADQNKATAVALLADTDWTEFPSVTKPGAIPQLLNASAFEAYRSVIRLTAINPPAGHISWPHKPSAEWKL